MKPDRCEICGVGGSELPPELRGDSVLFSNYEPPPAGESLGFDSPEGVEYFCGRHLEAAKALSHLSSDEAIAKLRLETGISPPIRDPQAAPPTLMQRLSAWFSR